METTAATFSNRIRTPLMLAHKMPNQDALNAITDIINAHLLKQTIFKRCEPLIEKMDMDSNQKASDLLNNIKQSQDPTHIASMEIQLETHLFKASFKTCLPPNNEEDSPKPSNT